MLNKWIMKLTCDHVSGNGKYPDVIRIMFSLQLSSSTSAPPPAVVKTVPLNYLQTGATPGAGKGIIVAISSIVGKCFIRVSQLTTESNK